MSNFKLCRNYSQGSCSYLIFPLESFLCVELQGLLYDGGANLVFIYHWLNQLRCQNVLCTSPWCSSHLTNAHFFAVRSIVQCIFILKPFSVTNIRIGSQTAALAHFGHNREAATKGNMVKYAKNIVFWIEFRPEKRLDLNLME